MPNQSGQAWYGIQLYTVQENFSMTCRIRIFDLYPIVFNLFVRCFLILFGGQFGRVSRGTLPILATIHAVLIKLHREYVLHRSSLFFLTGFYGSIYPSQDILRDRALYNCCSPVSPTNGRISWILCTCTQRQHSQFLYHYDHLTDATAPIPCRRRCN